MMTCVGRDGTGCHTGSASSDDLVHRRKTPGLLVDLGPGDPLRVHYHELPEKAILLERPARPLPDRRRAVPPRQECTRYRLISFVFMKNGFIKHYIHYYWIKDNSYHEPSKYYKNSNIDASKII